MARPYVILVLLILTSISPLLHAVKSNRKPASETSVKPVVPAVPNAAMGIAYLALLPASPPIRPFFDPLPTDTGLQGARLGILDNNTTGRFTRQYFNLKETLVPVDGDLTAAFKGLIAEGYRYLLLDLPASEITHLAALPEGQNVLLFNIASHDDRLRAAECRANVLHLLPSDAMRADALAQYLAKKRWKKWLLVSGTTEEDQRYAEALRRSARKFGNKIVAEKTWGLRFENRRTPEAEVPVVTQDDDHDVVVVVDERLEFGDYLPYRTWLPRPVVGTAGLISSAWHFTHEAWGALQLQNRFREQAGRWMTETDYGSWLAVRAIGEAATRTRSVELDQIKSFLLGEQFSLAGFKGVPLSFRPWDHQLRQPVLLSTERSLVAVAPIEGYLHPKNELDTLGFDAPETACRF
ncbi:MAG: ABC transporter substrate-binding protein [Methylococcaceae bacterium]|nr:ABC transporter substrate-binding protein [Methylococcaceae bacterium]